MNRDEKIGLFLSVIGGLGFFLNILNQTQGVTLSILGFVLVYTQRLTGGINK